MNQLDLEEEDYAVQPHWRKSAFLTSLGIGLITLIYISPVHSLINDSFARKLEYSFRAAVDKKLPLDPRIKMIAFDDYTAGVLQRPDLTLEDWALIFEFLAANKPKVIFVDRIFGFPLGSSLNHGVSASEAELFVERMRALEVPLVIGSFFQSTKIVQRPTLNLERNAYRLDDLLLKNEDISELDRIPWLKKEEGYVYGPHPLIAPAFTRIGHINNEGGGYIRPVVRVSDQHLMAHSAIMSVGDLRFAGGKFSVGDHHLPISSDGRLILNLSDRESYYAQTKNLLSFIRKINAEESDNWIDRGDFVAVLPMMYTGNTDMKDVPIGRLQGSYVNISAINNVLSNNWLKEAPFTWIWIILCGVGAGTLGLLLAPANFLLSTVVFVLAQALLGLSLFSYSHTIFPWPYTITATLLCGGIVFVDKAKKVEERKRAAVLKAQQGARVRNLLHVVCHDIANPLMIVTTRTKMMGGDFKKVVEDEKNATNIDKIAFAAEKVRNIINSVRELEAAEMGKAAIDLEAVSLREIFRAVFVNFEDLLKKKQLRLEHNLMSDHSDILVMADRTSLENFVIHNLVSNAIKFSTAGKSITLSATRIDRDRVRVVVRDQGIGIPEEIRTQIFSSTASTTRVGTDNERGTGFGMPIVKVYIQKFGGDIEVKSKTIEDHPTDHGTEIQITLIAAKTAH